MSRKTLCVTFGPLFSATSADSAFVADAAAADDDDDDENTKTPVSSRTATTAPTSGLLTRGFINWERATWIKIYAMPRVRELVLVALAVLVCVARAQWQTTDPCVVYDSGSGMYFDLRGINSYVRAPCRVNQE